VALAHSSTAEEGRGRTRINRATNGTWTHNHFFDPDPHPLTQKGVVAEPQGDITVVIREKFSLQSSSTTQILNPVLSPSDGYNFKEKWAAIYCEEEMKAFSREPGIRLRITIIHGGGGTEV
jgi:hypothetical protein